MTATMMNTLNTQLHVINEYKIPYAQKKVKEVTDDLKSEMSFYDNMRALVNVRTSGDNVSEMLRIEKSVKHYNNVLDSAMADLEILIDEKIEIEKQIAEETIRNQREEMNHMIQKLKEMGI